MKNVFVKTKNVKNFVTLMDKLQKLPPNIPKLALVYGEHGLGKTHSIMWWAVRNDAVYIRANNEITQNGLLKGIVEELGERPFYQMQENYSLILKHLKQEPKIIIVDEADYLIGNKNVIEILRDIQDNSGTPIVLVGMGMMDKKIARFKHFEDRIYQKLKFEHFNQEDIREILEQLTELNFTPDLEDKFGTHTMRKTFGYHHYKKFKDVAMLQKIFNHSSPEITLRYIGIEQDEIDESYTNFVI